MPKATGWVCPSPGGVSAELWTQETRLATRTRTRILAVRWMTAGCLNAIRGVKNLGRLPATILLISFRIETVRGRGHKQLFLEVPRDSVCRLA